MCFICLKCSIWWRCSLFFKTSTRRDFNLKLFNIFLFSKYWYCVALNCDDYHFLSISCNIYIIHSEKEMSDFKKNINAKLRRARSYNNRQYIWNNSKTENIRRTQNQSSNWVHGNSSHFVWVYQFELTVILLEIDICQRKIWN